MNEFSGKTKDRLLSYGELISSKIVSSFFSIEALPNVWVDARSIIKTNSNYTKAAVEFDVTRKKVNEFFSASDGNLFIVPGFIASAL